MKIANTEIRHTQNVIFFFDDSDDNEVLNPSAITVGEKKSESERQKERECERGLN
jgi:hypothetical protein